MLEVKEAARSEVFADTVRIPRKYRNSIPNGAVVRMVHGRKKAYAVTRGVPGHDDKPVILMDEFLRRTLGLKVGDRIDPNHITEVKWCQKLIWYLNASNPAVRVPAWVAVISLVLGVISIGLGVISLIIAFRIP